MTTNTLSEELKNLEQWEARLKAEAKIESDKFHKKQGWDSTKWATTGFEFGYIERAKKLKAEITILDTLYNYADHRRSCVLFNELSSRFNCECGYDEADKKLKELRKC